MNLSGRTYNFSAGFRLSNSQWTELKNQQVYGDDWSPEGSAYNYVLKVFWPLANSEAEVAQQDSWARQVVAHFDHCLLNDKISADLRPTLEVLGASVWQALEKLGDVQKIHINQANGFSCIIIKDLFPEVTIAHSLRINALHRHHNEELSSEENKMLYGKCATTHGHEYRVKLMLTGSIKEELGQIVDRELLQNILNEQVFRPLHGKMLNEIIGNTSGELLLAYLQKKLAKIIPSDLILDLELVETEKNRFFTPRAISFV